MGEAVHLASEWDGYRVAVAESGNTLAGHHHELHDQCERRAVTDLLRHYLLEQNRMKSNVRRKMAFATPAAAFACQEDGTFTSGSGIPSGKVAHILQSGKSIETAPLRCRYALLRLAASCANVGQANALFPSDRIGPFLKDCEKQHIPLQSSRQALHAGLQARAPPLP